MYTTLSFLLLVGGAFGQASHPSYSVKRIAGAPQARVDGGSATAALLMRPFSLAQDRSGRLFIADRRGISVVGTGGELRIVTGSSTISARGIANEAILGNDPTGEILVAEGSRVLRRFSDGRQAVVAGGGPAGARAEGIPATQADLACVSGLASDRAGNIYVSCIATAVVRRIGADGLIRTVAGNFLPGSSGDGGLATRAQVVPWHITTDAAGSLYIFDVAGLRVRRVTADGVIQTIAGGGTSTAEGVNPLLAALNPVGGLAVDGTGNVYVSEPAVNRVRRFAPGGSITTIAGSAANPGDAGDGGAAGTARLNQPGSLLVDRDGSVLVVDAGNNRVRRVTQGIFPAISAVAGASHVRGDGGVAIDALLNGPASIALDASGNVFVADSLNARVRKVAADSGLMSTVAGTGSPGFSGDGGPAVTAELRLPAAVAVDREGTLLIADRINERIRRVGGNGVITTLASGLTNPGPMIVDRFGNVLFAQGGQLMSLSAGGGVAAVSGVEAGAISGIAQDGQGNVYLTDEVNHVVLRVGASGGVQVIAGRSRQSGNTGDGGLASAALLNRPKTIAADTQGNLVIADADGKRLRYIGQDGRIDTVAGRADSEPPLEAPFGQPGLATTFGQITALSFDSSGAIYYSDGDLGVVGKLTALMPSKVSIVSGDMQTGVTESKLPANLVVKVTDAQGLPIAGIGVNFWVLSGVAYFSSETVLSEADGTASVAVTLGTVAGPVVVASSTSGLTPVMFSLTAVARFVPQPPAVTKYLVDTLAGSALPNEGSVVLRAPVGVAVDRDGNVFVSDPPTNRVLARASDGSTRLFAGTGVRGAGVARDFAYKSRISGPAGMAAGPNSSVYFADRENHRICRVTGDQVFEVAAGTGDRGYNGDQLIGLATQLARPAAVAVDPAGAVYIADTENYLIRRLELSGVVVNVVGTGRQGVSEDGTAATEAAIGIVESMAVDGQGRLYFAEGASVRMVSGAGSLMTVVKAESAVRGLAFDGAGNLYFTAGTGVQRLGADGVLAAVTVEGLVAPMGLAVDAEGNLWIADGGSGRLVRVDAKTGESSTAAGGAVPSGDDGFANLALLNAPLGLAADVAGGVYIADAANLRIRYVTPGGVMQTVVGGTGGIRLTAPGYVAVDARDTLYFSDGGMVRRLTVGRALTTVAGPFPQGAIGCMTVNPAGEVTLCIGNQIHRLAADGQLQLIAGNGQPGVGADGVPAVSVSLTQPRSAVYDKLGNLLFVEVGNRKVRRVAPNGVITTVVGAALEAPVAVAVDSDGNIYVAEPYRIGKISPDGVIVTIAGVGSNGFGGDGGAAGDAEFDGIQAMVVDAMGNLLVSDVGNNRVRKLSPIF